MTRATKTFTEVSGMSDAVTEASVHCSEEQRTKARACVVRLTGEADEELLAMLGLDG